MAERKAYPVDSTSSRSLYEGARLVLPDGTLATITRMGSCGVTFRTANGHDRWIAYNAGSEWIGIKAICG